jgi:type I restriction enzyme M protein
VTCDDIEACDYDLKAVNPHRVLEEDTRTPEELLDEIERQQAIIAEAIAELRGL